MKIFIIRTVEWISYRTNTQRWIKKRSENIIEKTIRYVMKSVNMNLSDSLRNGNKFDYSNLLNSNHKRIKHFKSE